MGLCTAMLWRIHSCTAPPQSYCTAAEDVSDLKKSQSITSQTRNESVNYLSDSFLTEYLFKHIPFKGKGLGKLKCYKMPSLILTYQSEYLSKHFIPKKRIGPVTNSPLPNYHQPHKNPMKKKRNGLGGLYYQPDRTFTKAKIKGLGGRVYKPDRNSMSGMAMVAVAEICESLRSTEGSCRIMMSCTSSAHTVRARMHIRADVRETRPNSRHFTRSR